MKTTLTLLLSLACGDAFARDWYLSPLGNDGGNGSQAQPLRSISRLLDPAANRVSAGDHLILRGGPNDGPFRESEIRLRTRLTVSAFPGEHPRIECPVDRRGEGLVETDGRTPIVRPDTVCVQIDPAASGSVISGLDISGSNLYGIFLQTDWDQRDAPDGVGASNVVIEDSKVHDTGRDAIKVTPKSANLTVRRSEIYRTGQIYAANTPADDRNAEGIDNVQGHAMLVQDSWVHDIATSGIYFKGGAADVVIERNRVERVGGGGILAGFDTSPDFFDLRQNPQYFEAVRGVVRNNVVVDTGLAGIGLFASNATVVANNTIIDSAKLAHAAIYFGVSLQDYEPQALRPANSGATIVNNIVLQRSSAGACAAIRYADELGGLSSLSGTTGMDFNLYSSATGCRFLDQRPGSGIGDGGSLSQWRQRLTSDASSFEAPIALAADAHLPAGSPAIDKGRAIAQVTDDIDRQPRSGVPDIGADEFAGAVAPTPGLLISGAQSGAWFNPARGGEGFLLEIGSVGGLRTFVASWYTYRGGRQEWLYGNVTLNPMARSVSVPMLRTRGAQFGSQFRASDVVIEPWGTVVFEFSGCNALSARYTETGGESGVLTLQRILPDGIEGLNCN